MYGAIYTDPPRGNSTPFKIQPFDKPPLNIAIAFEPVWQIQRENKEGWWEPNSKYIEQNQCHQFFGIQMTDRVHLAIIYS